MMMMIIRSGKYDNGRTLDNATFRIIPLHLEHLMAGTSRTMRKLQLEQFGVKEGVQAMATTQTSMA
jgi:hypothetical protein